MKKWMKWSRNGEYLEWFEKPDQPPVEGKIAKMEAFCKQHAK